MLSKLIILFILVINSYSCKVDDRIMFSIASVEKHKDRDVGYPYLISFNNNRDAIRVKKVYTEYFLDNRTIDCLNTNICTQMLDSLLKVGIKNLDLGVYQLNYIYWKMDKKENYFDLMKSYDKACSIVESHNKDEWTWTNIAKYHSGTPKYNNRYKKLLLKSIKRNM